MMMKIEQSIENINSAIEDYVHADDEKYNTGLLSGTMGITLFSYYYAKLKGKDNRIADEFLDKTLNICVSTAQTDTYGGGLAGVGFGIEHLNQHNFIETDTNLLLTDFDEYLSQSLNIYLSKKDYDFLRGSTGFGIYFLKRAVVNRENKKWIECIINELKANLHKGNGKEAKWFTHILNDNGEDYRQVYNICLSHGMSAILFLLAKSYSMKICKEETSIIIQGVVEYILNQEIDKSKYGSYYPALSKESEEVKYGSRLAWCYGDLGVASILYQAGTVMQNDSWKDKAIEVLLFAAEKRRHLEANGIKDACLCHGTAGVAHIFYRTWWNTRLPEFKKAADFWFQETLKMAKFFDGLAGFKTYHPKEYGGWSNQYDMLEGIAGIGLAMLSYITETEPTWDECLLLS